MPKSSLAESAPIPLLAWRAIGCVALTAALAAQSPGTPQGQPAPLTFRSGVTYVELEAVVTDRQGAFVRDLLADELQLFEDGRIQPISTFSAVVPSAEPNPSSEAARATAAAESTGSNEGARPGRLYVIVLDDLHTAPTETGRAKAIVRRFIEHYLGPSDLAAMLSTASSKRIVTDFTASRETLLASIDRFMGRRPNWTPSSGPTIGCFT